MKTNAIYSLPKSLKYNLSKYTKDGCINVSDISVEDIQKMFEQSNLINEWIIENIWEGEFENYEAIGKRLAFLLDLRDRDFETYNPMSDEKCLIYELQNDHPEIYTSYRKWVTHE